MFLADLLFPKFCLGCGYIGVYICQSCQKKLKPVKTDICFYCKKPSLYGLTHTYCINKFNVDGITTLYYYTPFLRKLIKNIKYRLAYQVWSEFSRGIDVNVIKRLDFYNKISNRCVMQPIPLSKNRFAQRGFNQAKFISRFFQTFLQIPIVDLLIKKNETSPQAMMITKKERHINVKGAFGINLKYDSIIKKTTDLILVDDIVTTGSTVKEAARILKLFGIRNVYVLALAKG